MNVGGGGSSMLMENTIMDRVHPVAADTAVKVHVAIICDGNGRWASSRGLPRSEGHRAGAEAARRIIRCAPHLGIHTLTLFALSSANWQRPPAEVDAILGILEEYLQAETSRCLEEGVRLSIIGRRDRLPARLRSAITDAEALTAKGTALHRRSTIRRDNRFSRRQPSFTKLPTFPAKPSAIYSPKCNMAARLKWIC